MVARVRFVIWSRWHRHHIGDSWCSFAVAFAIRLWNGASGFIYRRETSQDTLKPRSHFLEQCWRSTYEKIMAFFPPGLRAVVFKVGFFGIESESFVTPCSSRSKFAICLRFSIVVIKSSCLETGKYLSSFLPKYLLERWLAHCLSKHFRTLVHQWLRTMKTVA
jgi:hypothetical protein